MPRTVRIPCDCLAYKHKHNNTTQTEHTPTTRADTVPLLPHTQVPIASPPIPAAPTRTPDLPKFDRIVQWAKGNAPLEVAKIEAHRRTVASCVRAASKMRIWSGEYRRPQRGSMPHPFMQREFPEIRRDKFEPGVFLSKTEFEAAALARPDPLDGAEAAATADMAPDLRAAIDFVAECGPDIVDERDQRLKRLRVIASMLEPLREVLDGIKLPCARLIADEFNVAWTVVALEAIQWPDDELALRYIIGFPVVFDIPDSGVFREIVEPALISEAEFMATNVEMNRSIKQSLSKTPAGEEEKERAAMCWKRTKEEIEAGLVFGPMSGAQLDRKYGRGKWRAMKRSAIVQGDKVRCIDDAKRNRANKATHMHETVVCSRSDFPAKVARSFAERALAAGHPIPMMEHGLEDLFAAYRRVPTSQPQFTLVALWRPDPTLEAGGEVVYVEVPGHNFGLVSSVVNFNRAPEAFIAVARQLLGVVAEHYVDDFDTCEPTFAKKTGAEGLVELCSPTFFGFAFADEKHEEMDASNVYLGVLTDFSTLLSEGSIIVGITQKRRKKLRDLVDTALAASVVPGAITQSIIGKARFVLSAAFSSIGKACLQPLQQHASQREPTPLSEWARDSMEFVRLLCDIMPNCRIPIFRSEAAPIIIFTDAEGKKRKGNQAPSGHIGFKVIHPTRGSFWSYAPVPTSIVKLLDEVRQRDTYIGQFEVIAAISAFLSFPPEFFEGRPVQLWIDNSGAIGCLIKGYSGKADCAKLVNAFHFVVATRGLASLYIDYVPTDSNIADVPSRWHEMSAAEREEWIPRLGQFVHPILPNVADDQGRWLKYTSIAKSLWDSYTPQ